MDTFCRRLIRLVSLLLTCFVVPQAVEAQRDSSRIGKTGGVNFGAPLAVSGSFAIVLERRPRQWGQPDGPFVGAELGVLGASVHVGRLTALDGGARSFRVGAMQWWGRGQNTYVGGDLRFMAFLANIGVGAYTRVAGTRGPVLLPALTFGFGY
jgi:hypothetical protein